MSVEPEVRTRFAPSPTGFLHIGGIRTALYAYMLAKRHSGKFLLRIEDTDQERLVPGSIRYILQEFEWFGLTIDEGPSPEELKQVGEYWDGAPNIGGPCGPYIQSLRLPRYKEVAEQLIASGHAYRCDCSAEMLERERLEQMARKEVPGYSGYCRDRNVSPDKPHVVRFRMPSKRQVILEDAIKGRVIWDDASLRDTILQKSEGFPTYHLAAMVDDHDMRITHVMRGDEWLSSTPLHLLIYEALGWKAPIFSHLPVILGPSGKKLSKRDGATHVSAFREQGYLPEALRNYVALVGWSPGEGSEQEVFSIEEMTKQFSLEHCNKASAVFDYSKLAWMNGLYIRQLSDDVFNGHVKRTLEAAGLKFDEATLRLITPHIKERVKILPEAVPMIDFLFTDKIERNLADMYQKGIDAPKAKEILGKAKVALNSLTDFSHNSIDAALRPIAEQFGLKVGPMLGVIRIAVTGKKVTPPLFESLAALGKERTLLRIEETYNLL